MSSNLVTCKKCGWVHFAVTRAHAEAEIKRFNEYYDSLTEEKQEFYYGSKKSGMHNYDRCFLCGPGATFRPFKEGDCPTGCTIQPCIYEEADGEEA